MKKNNKYKLKILIQTTIIAICFIVVFLAIIKPSNELYSYSITQNSDYNVYIKPNEYIETNVIKKDNIYLENMVDYIETIFEYQYYATQKANLDYKYDIIATLMIDYANTNQNIIKKQYDIIKDKTLIVENENKINISEKININYNSYRNQVINFREKYQVPIKAYVKVEFIIKTGIQQDKQIQKRYEESSQEIIIDLTQNIFEISENKTQDKQEQIIQPREYNKYLIWTSLIIIIISTIYIINLVKQNKEEKIGKHKLEIEKILRKYGNIIVELKEETNIGNKNIVTVKNFNELLDLEEEIREPILFYEKNDKHAVFFIFSNQIRYQYILNDEKNKNIAKH